MLFQGRRVDRVGISQKTFERITSRRPAPVDLSQQSELSSRLRARPGGGGLSGRHLVPLVFAASIGENYPATSHRRKSCERIYLRSKSRLQFQNLKRRRRRNHIWVRCWRGDHIRIDAGRNNHICSSASGRLIDQARNRLTI